jgi:arylformamidase
VRFLDISSPIYEGMPAFPGDPAVRVRRVRSLAGGDPYNLSELTLGSHAGTHVDPPVHFVADGATIDQLDLGTLNGPCQVVEVPAQAPSVRPGHLKEVATGTERLLLKTSNSARWATRDEFFEEYVALDPSAAESLVALGVRLVGIDALSIESDPSGRFPVHHRLLGAGVLILEGIRLAGVAPGRYELRLMPLRIRGGDGGPARAALLAP